LNKLLKYLTENALKPTPWANDNKISPSTISRCLNGRSISWDNAKKISAATLGEVSVSDLMENK